MSEIPRKEGGRQAREAAKSDQFNLKRETGEEPLEGHGQRVEAHRENLGNKRDVQADIRQDQAAPKSGK